MPLAIGVPLGAQGPVRYDSTGMYCSFACAKADVLTREETPAASRVAARASLRIFMVVSVIEVGKARSGKGAASTRSERAWGAASRRRAAPSRLGPPWGAASTRSERAWGSCSSVREGPKPELLLGCGPKFGQAMRLDDQEPHDQAAKDHQLGVRGRGGADVAPDQAGQEGQELVQRNRQDHDEGRAEEAAH